MPNQDKVRNAARAAQATRRIQELQKRLDTEMIEVRQIESHRANLQQQLQEVVNLLSGRAGRANLLSEMIQELGGNPRMELAQESPQETPPEPLPEEPTDEELRPTVLAEPLNGDASHDDFQQVLPEPEETL